MGQDALGGSSSKSGVGSEQFRKGLSNAARGLMAPGAERETALAQFMINPERYKTIGDEYARSAGGGYLNPSGVPQLQELLRTFQQQHDEGLGAGLAKLRSRFALGGHTSTAGSGPLLNAQKQAIVSAGNAKDALAAQALFGLYGQERAYQQNALERLGAYEQTPINLLQMLAPLMQKNSAVDKKGYVNAIGSAIGAIAAGVAGCRIAQAVLGKENFAWFKFYLWKETLAPKWFKKMYNKCLKIMDLWDKVKEVIHG